MSFFDVYKNYLNATGGSVAGSQEGNSIQAINNSFADSPFYRNDVLINGVVTEVRVIEEKLSKNKTLLFKPLIKVDMGSICHFDNFKWIVIDSLTDNDLFPKVRIDKCNSTIELLGTPTETDTGEKDWRGAPIYSKTYPNAVSIPCVVTTKLQIRDFTEFDKQINLPNGRILITIPYQNSPSIYEGLAFPMYGEKFQVVDIDMTQVYGTVGLINMVAEKVVEGSGA